MDKTSSPKIESTRTQDREKESKNESKKNDEPKLTCYGCIHLSPGQRDHMEEGGCLEQY